MFLFQDSYDGQIKWRECNSSSINLLFCDSNSKCSYSGVLMFDIFSEVFFSDLLTVLLRLRYFSAFNFLENLYVKMKWNMMFILYTLRLHFFSISVCRMSSLKNSQAKKNSNEIWLVVKPTYRQTVDRLRWKLNVQQTIICCPSWNTLHSRLKVYFSFRN